MTLISEYIAAYRAVHGEEPQITQIGDKFSIATKTGSHDGYTAKDVRNLTRVLRRLAK